MKKLMMFISVLLLIFTLVGCKVKTTVVAEITNLEYTQTTVNFSVTIDDVNNEITGSTVIYLHNEDGNVRNQKTIEEDIELENIYFYGLEPESEFEIKVIATIGRDALEIASQKFTTQSADEIIINTADDFLNMIDNKSGNYVLGQDIDFSTINFRSPFNASNTAFSGVFDGNGYALKNINFQNVETYTGVFGYVSSGVIKNVTFDNVKIGSIDAPLSTGTSSRVGIVVGYSRSETTRIEDVVVKNSSIVFSSSSAIKVSVGAISGEFLGAVRNVEIINTAIDVTSTSIGAVTIGGAIGLTTSNANIQQVYAETSIDFELAGTNIRNDDVSILVGGVVGLSSSESKVSEIISHSDINLEIMYNTLADATSGIYRLYVGGLMGQSKNDIQKGYYAGSINMNHTENENEAEVTKQFRVGGLIGMYESNKPSHQLVRIGEGQINVTIPEEMTIDISQVFGFDRENVSSDKGVFGTTHLSVNQVSIVDNDQVDIIEDISDYFDSEWIESYRD